MLRKLLGYYLVIGEGELCCFWILSFTVFCYFSSILSKVITGYVQNPVPTQKDWTIFSTTVEHYFALIKSITKCKDVFPVYSDSEDITILDYIFIYVTNFC